MFVVAGALAVGVVGVIAHDDHSDYSDWYDDYAEKERKKKQAKLAAKEKELALLKKQLKQECQEVYQTIQAELDSVKPVVDIDVKQYSISNIKKNTLIPDVKQRLEASLQEDKETLADINATLRRINEIQLQAKKSLEVEKK